MVNLQRQRNSRLGLWQTLCTLATLLIVGSVWIAQSTRNQLSSTTSPLGQTLSLMATSQALVQPTQALNADFDQSLQATLQSVTTLVDAPAPLPPVLKTKLGALKTELAALQVETEKAAQTLLKPAGMIKLLNGKSSTTASKALLPALQQWASTVPDAADTAPTWAQLTQSQTAWTQVMSAVQTLQAEAQNSSSKNVKLAKDVLASFATVAPLHAMEAHTQVLDTLLQAHNQLVKSLSQPLTSEELAAAHPWDWRRLGYPAEPTQGLLLAAGLLLFNLALGHVARQAVLTEKAPSSDTHGPVPAQDLLAHRQWLSLLLHQREEAESAMAHLLEASDKLGQVQLESHVPLFQLIWQAQSQTPTLTHEQQHLQQASSAQRLLQEEVQRLQEKLINVHLQFCQGAHQDNLMYDLAYLSEAVKGLQASAEQVSQILNQGAHPPADAAQRPQPDQAFAERLDAWRAQLRDVKRQLNEAQSLLEKSLKNVAREESPASVFGSQASD